MRMFLWALVVALFASSLAAYCAGFVLVTSPHEILSRRPA